MLVYMYNLLATQCASLQDITFHEILANLDVITFHADCRRQPLQNIPLYNTHSAVSDVRVTVLMRVSEFTSVNVEAVELAQLATWQGCSVTLQMSAPKCAPDTIFTQHGYSQNLQQAAFSVQRCRTHRPHRPY